MRIDAARQDEMLKKRSVLLSGHATSVALEPEFWVVLDAIAQARGLSASGLLAWIDETRGRRPLASACRLAALDWAVRGTGAPHDDAPGREPRSVG